MAVTKLDLTHPELLTDWSKSDPNKDEIRHPSQPAETELLEYILECGLGTAEVQRLREDASKLKPRKSESSAGKTSVEEEVTFATKSRKREPKNAGVEVEGASQLTDTANTAAYMPSTVKPVQKRKTKKTDDKP